MKKKKILGTVAAVLAITTALTGCGTSTSPQAAGTGSTSSATITVGTTPLVSSAPIFLAEGLGYWKNLGLHVQIQTYTAANTIDVSTAANSLDVSATGITASLFNLWNSGKKEYIVADKGRIWPGQQFEALVASDKAWNEGVKTVADLKGKTFGNTATGSTFDYLLGVQLEQNHLSLKDITDKPLTAVPNLVSAVETGQVDATVLPQPFYGAALKTGKVHLIEWIDDNVKADLLVIAYSPNFRQHQADAVKFMQGYLEAVKYYDQHMYKNTNPNDPDFKKGLDIIAKYTKAKPEAIKSGLIYIDPNGEVDPANIQKQLAFYQSNGFVKGSLTVSDMIDSSFLKQAQAKLASK